MAKTIKSSTRRYSLADKYLLKLLSDTKLDFKAKRSDIIKIKQSFINENEQDFDCIIHDELNKTKVEPTT